MNKKMDKLIKLMKVLISKGSDYHDIENVGFFIYQNRDIVDELERVYNKEYRSSGCYLCNSEFHNTALCDKCKDAFGYTFKVSTDTKVSMGDYKLYNISCCSWPPNGYHCAGMSHSYHCKYCGKDFHPQSGDKKSEGDYKKEKLEHEKNCKERKKC